MAKLIQTLIPL